MSWLELHLQVPDHLVEQAEDALLGLGALSVTLKDNADEPILEPALGTQPLWSQTRLIGLFESTVEADLILSLVQQQLPGDAIPGEWHQLDERIWEREWLQHFQPLKITPTFWVNTEAVDQPGVTTLLLDPGLAFGTGTHPTTALCLEWLANQNFRGQELIDFGCGSGILAIAALLRQAEKVYCLDIDPQALTATGNNMDRNAINRDRYQLLKTLEELPRAAEVLVANILAGPLIDYAEAVAERVVDGGHLCLSGILREQAQSVCDAYAPWFQNLEVTTREDWVRITGTR